MSERSRSHALTTAFAVAYPIVAHVAVARGSAAWAIGAMTLLAAAALLPGLLQARLFAWSSVPIVAGVCWLLARASTPVVLLYIAPILVPAFMAWVFGHTLSGARTPLIAQLIRVLHENDDQQPEPAVWSYARRLTLAWTVFFVALAGANLLLAALAEPDGLLLASGVRPPIAVPQFWWSMFANLIGYLLVAAFFAIEYAYRRHLFPQQPYRNMYDFLRQATSAMPRLLRGDR